MYCEICHSETCEHQDTTCPCCHDDPCVNCVYDTPSQRHLKNTMNGKDDEQWVIDDAPTCETCPECGGYFHQVVCENCGYPHE